MCVPSGKKGNLTERPQPVGLSLALSIPSIVGCVFLLIWQTYVLRVELILVSVQLSLIGLEFFLGLVAIILFSRWVQVLANHYLELSAIRILIEAFFQQAANAFLHWQKHMILTKLLFLRVNVMISKCCKRGSSNSWLSILLYLPASTETIIQASAFYCNVIITSDCLSVSAICPDR